MKGFLHLNLLSVVFDDWLRRKLSWIGETIINIWKNSETNGNTGAYT
jgi:hypothetical protein